MIYWRQVDDDLPDDFALRLAFSNHDDLENHSKCAIVINYVVCRYLIEFKQIPLINNFYIEKYKS